MTPVISWPPSPQAKTEVGNSVSATTNAAPKMRFHRDRMGMFMEICADSCGRSDFFGEIVQHKFTVFEFAASSFCQRHQNRAGDDEKGAHHDARGDLFHVAQKNLAAKHDPQRQSRGQRRDDNHRTEAESIEHQQQAEGLEGSTGDKISERVAIPDELLLRCGQAEIDTDAEQADDESAARRR